MNKSQLVSEIAQEAQVTKEVAGNTLDATIGAVTKALKKGDSVTLVGFGTFQVRSRSAREGRNPKTGAPIQISASRVPSFKAGKGLKDALK